MAYDIHKKINSIFSEEFVFDKSILLSPKSPKSPKRLSKKKNKKIKYGSNIITNLEDSLNKNKEENSIIKNKKRKSSKLKKKEDKIIHNPSHPQIFQEQSNKSSKKHKLRQMKTTVVINLKNIQKSPKKRRKEYNYKENENFNDIGNEMNLFLKKKVNSNNNKCFKRIISKEILKPKEKGKEGVKDNKKEKKKKLDKEEFKKTEKVRHIDTLIYRKKDEKDNDKNSDLYLSVSEDSISSQNSKSNKSNKSHKNNNNQKIKKSKVKIIAPKKSQKLENFIIKENKNIKIKNIKEEKMLNNNKKEIIKDKKRSDEFIISKENNKNRLINNNNTLISYNSEKDSENIAVNSNNLINLTFINFFAFLGIR